MHLLEHLKHEHEQVKAVLGRLADTTARASKGRHSGMNELRKLLMPHMDAEEQVFYPALIELGQTELAYSAMEEHRAARTVLEDLQSLDVSDERWHAYLKVLSELLTHHIAQEEQDVFDAVRKEMDDHQQDELGQMIMNREKLVKQSL